MKTLKSTVILLLVSLICIAQELKPKVAFDYFPGNSALILKENIQDPYRIKSTLGEYRTRVGLDFKYKKITIYCDTHVHMDRGDRYFNPTQAYFYAGVRYKLSKTINFTAEHLCIHPIETLSVDRVGVYGGYNMLSISYNYDN